MKVKVLYGISAAAFIAAAQLLFFWLISTSSDVFPAIYPFYTVLTVAHMGILFYIFTKFKYPACFAPALVGSIITVIEVIGSILLGLFCESVRTILFGEALTIITYILLVALLVGITLKESVDSDAPFEPIRPFITNTVSGPTRVSETSARRMPKAVDENNNA